MDSGWTLEEALARTSDPRLWDRYEAEKRQQTATLAELRRSLITELLAKIGTQLFAAALKPTDSEDGWIILDRAALEEKTSERIGELKLFVPLKAPNAVEHLRDRGLAEVFRQYVLDDPEVAVLLKRNRTPDLFKGGRAPGWFVGYYWPLEATAADLARLIEGGLIILGGPDRRPTREVSTLSEALADRIGALRDLLVSGKIRAFGLSSLFGESFVPPRQWARKNLSIDVANSDLCEEHDRDGSFVQLWTGIEFRSPMTDISHYAQSAEHAASSKKRSDQGQEVELIIRTRQIDARKGRKAAAAEVAQHMSKPPVSESAVKALEVQVGRISKVVNKAR